VDGASVEDLLWFHSTSTPDLLADPVSPKSLANVLQGETS
jgi:hypothetical protein